MEFAFVTPTLFEFAIVAWLEKRRVITSSAKGRAAVAVREELRRRHGARECLLSIGSPRVSGDNAGKMTIGSWTAFG